LRLRPSAGASFLTSSTGLVVARKTLAGETELLTLAWAQQRHQ
jgi:hypothetical protein